MYKICDHKKNAGHKTFFFMAVDCWNKRVTIKKKAAHFVSASLQDVLNILLHRLCSCTHGQKFVDTRVLYPHGTVELLILKSQVFICCCNSLHSSEMDFHKILEPSYRDLLPFSQNCISEFGHWFEVMFEFNAIPKLYKGVSMYFWPYGVHWVS